MTAIKKCSRCGIADRSSKSYCQPCKNIILREWRARRANYIRQAAREWYAVNIERNREWVRRWRAANPQTMSRCKAEWKKANKATVNFSNANRTAKKRLATPAWADAAQIKAVYENGCKWGMEVDHVVPLQHDLVCGLHVWHNLQLLHPLDNRAKLNHHWPDMP